MNVNLHIERFILDSISVEPHLRPLVAASLEAELGRLLGHESIASGSSLRNGGAFRTIRTEAVGMGESGGPSHLGRQIARSIYGGIN